VRGRRTETCGLVRQFVNCMYVYYTQMIGEAKAVSLEGS
jgi:hypothetical protein